MKLSYILILLFNFNLSTSINFNDPKYKNLKVDHNKKIKKKANKGLEEIVIDMADYILGFTLLHSNMKYYATYLKLQFKLKENVVIHKVHESGSIMALQFYNNSHVFNINPNNKLKSLPNKDEIIGDPYMIFYHFNEQNNIISYHLILNNSATRKHLTYIPKDMIQQQYIVNEDFTILIPVENLNIGDLALKKLFPYIMSYHNRPLQNKNNQMFRIKEPQRIRMTLDSYTRIEEDTMDQYNENPVYQEEKKFLMDENGNFILDENGYTQFENPLDAIQIPDEYLVFQYFIKFPKANEAKILFVYTDLNLNIIKMEIKKTFLSKNYYNKNLIKNWFLRTINIGKPTNGSVCLLNNIIIRSPFLQLNIGIILDHHKFNDCNNKNNFLMVIASFDPKENIVLNVKRVQECCNKKPLNLM